MYDARLLAASCPFGDTQVSGPKCTMSAMGRPLICPTAVAVRRSHTVVVLLVSAVTRMSPAGAVRAAVWELPEDLREALVLTVDLAVPGSRYRDARAAGGGLKRLGQLLARPGWLWVSREKKFDQASEPA